MPERHLPAASGGNSLFFGLATFAILTTLLYFGAGIIVPIVLAVLLAFALTPLVNWLGRRLHLPDALAVIVAVLIAIGLLAGFAYLAGTQILHLAEELPGYQQTITTKLEGLRGFFGSGIFDRINDLLGNLSAQVSTPETTRPEGAPIPVTIANEIGPMSVVTSVLGSVVGPLATVFIVTVFLIFLLMGRADLQDRVIRLVSGGRYSTTNIAMADASRRVGRYLLIQLSVNVVYGALFGIGLTLIGVPSAILWGLLIVLFRYIPFVGALIVAVIPFLLAFAVDPGWNMLIMTVVLFLVIDQVTANIIEPRLYGSSTGVSAIAILLSAMFWGSLWGPVGLILATPMTVCLVVVGRHLPQLRFLEMLLGSEPVLSPEERLYQRMLKGDTADAITLTNSFIDEHDRTRYLQDVMIPALRLANDELEDRADALPQRRQLVQSFETVLDELGEIDWPDQSDILLIGGKTEIDECAAELVALALHDDGIPSRVLPPLAVRQEAIGRLDLEGVDVVVLVYMDSEIRAQARYVSRRISRMAPGVKILVCTLSDASMETAETMRVDGVYHSIETAAEGAASNLRRQLRRSSKDAGTVNPFEGSGRGDDALGQALNHLAEELEMPVAAINLLDDERHIDEEDAYRLTQHVVESGKTLVIRSSAPHPDIGENAYLQTNGIDIYAATPLTLPDGRTIGALAVIDYEPRDYTEQDAARLEAAAARLIEQFAGR